MKLTLEVNPLFSGDQGAIESDGQVIGMMTPEIGKDSYWLARVKVGKSQAVICFPKFGTVGIGFQKEAVDWNKNLPYSTPSGANHIYQHIACNKGKGPKEEECVQAIKMLINWVKLIMAKRGEHERRARQVDHRR